MGDTDTTKTENKKTSTAESYVGRRYWCVKEDHTVIGRHLLSYDKKKRLLTVVETIGADCTTKEMGLREAIGGWFDTVEKARESREASDAAYAIGCMELALSMVNASLRSASSVRDGGKRKKMMVKKIGTMLNEIGDAVSLWKYEQAKPKRLTQDWRP